MLFTIWFVCPFFRKKVGVFFCGPGELSTTLHKLCNRHSSSQGAKFFYNKEHFWTTILWLTAYVLMRLFYAKLNHFIAIFYSGMLAHIWTLDIYIYIFKLATTTIIVFYISTKKFRSTIHGDPRMSLMLPLFSTLCDTVAFLEVLNDRTSYRKLFRGFSSGNPSRSHPRVRPWPSVLNQSLGGKSPDYYPLNTHSCQTTPE